MADAYTKRLERRIHNQRVQLKWWDELMAERGSQGYRKLRRAVMKWFEESSRFRLQSQRNIFQIALEEIASGADEAQQIARKALSWSRSETEKAECQEACANGIRARGES
jgi:hypothetical protein